MMGFNVKANVSENRLYITASGGGMTVKEMSFFREMLKEECSKLKKGFTCIQDFRQLKPLSPELAKETEKNKKIVADSGLSKNAFIVNSVILKGQMNRTLNEKEGIPEKFFDNIEDAIKYLDS